MLPEPTQEQAALYSLSLLTEQAELANFERELAQSAELRALVKDLNETQAALLLSLPAVKGKGTLSDARKVDLKASVLGRIAVTSQQRFPAAIRAALREANFAEPLATDAVIFASRDGLLQWVNPAFTDLCGYTLSELRGNKPGARIQGPLTTPEAIDGLRQAMRNRRAVTQEIINYHRDGSPYRVSIDLRPVSAGFLAVERELEAV